MFVFLVGFMVYFTCFNIVVSIYFHDALFTFHCITGSALQPYLDAVEVDGGVAVMDEEIVENPDI